MGAEGLGDGDGGWGGDGDGHGVLGVSKIYKKWGMGDGVWGKYAQSMQKIGSYPSDLRVAIGMDGSFVDDQHDDLHIKNGDVP